MNKNNATKKQKKAIKQLAAIFPAQTLKESHVVNVSGKDLVTKGIDKDGAGKPVNKELVYTSVVQGAKKANHENRILATFQLGGRKAVKEYGTSKMKPEHHAEWNNVVDTIFDFEEFGIMKSGTYPNEQSSSTQADATENPSTPGDNDILTA
jgi:hypothetical protein